VPLPGTQQIGKSFLNTGSERDHGERISSELIVSSVLLLTSRYAAAAADGDECARLAIAIQCHLELLSERGDVPALVRDTCGLLAEEWRARLASEERLPCRRPGLRELVRRARLR